jgi:hypothetical protein
VVALAFIPAFISASSINRPRTDRAIRVASVAMAAIVPPSHSLHAFIADALVTGAKAARDSWNLPGASLLSLLPCAFHNNK